MTGFSPDAQTWCMLGGEIVALFAVEMPLLFSSLNSSHIRVCVCVWQSAAPLSVCVFEARGLSL